MRSIFAILLFLPVVSAASTLKTETCWRTNITTPVVSVCKAELDEKPAYTILTIDGLTAVYLAGSPDLIGSDPVFGTTKYKVPLTLLGNFNNGSFGKSTMPSAAIIYLGKNTSTGQLVYMQGSNEIDFLIDLRK